MFLALKQFYHAFMSSQSFATRFFIKNYLVGMLILGASFWHNPGSAYSGSGIREYKEYLKELNQIPPIPIKPKIFVK